MIFSTSAPFLIYNVFLFLLVRIPFNQQSIPPSSVHQHDLFSRSISSSTASNTIDGDIRCYLRSRALHSDFLCLPIHTRKAYMQLHSGDNSSRESTFTSHRHPVLHISHMRFVSQFFLQCTQYENCVPPDPRIDVEMYTSDHIRSQKIFASGTLVVPLPIRYVYQFVTVFTPDFLSGFDLKALYVAFKSRLASMHLNPRLIGTRIFRCRLRISRRCEYLHAFLGPVALPVHYARSAYLDLIRNITRKHDYDALFRSSLPIVSRDSTALFIATHLCKRKVCIFISRFRRMSFTCACLDNISEHMASFSYRSSSEEPNRRKIATISTAGGHIRYSRKASFVGGGRAVKSFSLDDLEQYLEPDCISLPADAVYKYVMHGSSHLAAGYSKNTYVHSKIPLDILVQKIPVISARQIARDHGIKIGSHIKPADLCALVKDHSCGRCAINVTVLSIEHAASGAVRAQKHRDNCKTHKRKKVPRTIVENAVVETQCEPDAIVRADFPPPPAGDDLMHDIISRACAKMERKNIEETGCAVCGQLKPMKSMAALRTVKNMLHILQAPGVTRIERKVDGPIKEFTGPVLDYSCTKVCKECRSCIRKGNVPRLALANDLWIGKVPPVLANLRFVEKLLVARIRHTCAFVKLASGGRKMQANVVAFESPIPKIYNMLPPPREDMDDVLAILFTGPCKPTMEELKDRTPFFVRRNAVMEALQWLKLNHSDYFDIEISEDNMRTYSETSPPVSIEYRVSDTNKVPEGTSVFETEANNGTSDGQCSFTVHGLTGEVLNTMSTSKIKAMALRYMNNREKFLAVGHSQEIESIWNNPKLYTSMYPWLFPYGLGGVGMTKLSDKAHKRFLLMYHDKRFQLDIDFPFVAFSHEQVKATTTQSFLLVEQRKFKDMSERLLNLDPTILQSVTDRLAAGEHVIPDTDQEKACFQVIKDLDSVAGKSNGSITQKKFMRNEIWSLIAHKGAPVWYVTLSPADTNHPICIYYAGTDEEFKPNILPYDERVRAVCQNPVAAARFFHFIVRTFISDVLGLENNRQGVYGETDAYYGTVEQQGRLSLHMHMMIWVKGCPNPHDMRAKMMEPDSEWHQKVKSWLESCHTGDFLTGSKEEVLNKVADAKLKPQYMDPTQTLPTSPPKMCKHPSESQCTQCGYLSKWWVYFRETVDDLLSRSNIHNCNRNMNADGGQKKGAPAGCMANRWGICKSRFPRETFTETMIDKETGAIRMGKKEPWLNTFTPIITYLFRCNSDTTSMTSGTAVKAVVLYISDYITKTTLKTHTIFDSVRAIFHKSSEMIGGTLSMQEKARRMMTRIVNLLSAKMEMGAPMICMYLLGNPDHYTDHVYVPFYWQSFVGEARRPFVIEGTTDTQLESHKVTIVRKMGGIVGISPVLDYIHRAPQLQNMTLYEWIRRCKRVKINTGKSRNKQQAGPENETECNDGISGDITDWEGDDPSGDISHELVDEDYYTDENNDKVDNKSVARRLGKNVYAFSDEHPLHRSHALHCAPLRDNVIPNYVGATLPRADQGDREYYCSSMLAFFKPWRTGLDLKTELQSWDDAFEAHPFTDMQKNIMSNYNIRYECLDARDDYRSQMKKAAGMRFLTSWDADVAETGDNEDVAENPGMDNPMDDVPLGPKQGRMLEARKKIIAMMTAMGWTQPKQIIEENVAVEPFKPELELTGNEWKAKVDEKRQECLDARLGNMPSGGTDENGTGYCRTHNLVKVVDKTFLDKNFDAQEHKPQIDNIAITYGLNTEQERAFRIVANHAVCLNPEPLKMYLGGMAGTGKSQVLKALSNFFELRNESYRFMVVAPTGTAAALLKGFTYHYVFGINEFSSRNGSGLSKVKSRLQGVEYVFLDEVSMLSCLDLYRISSQCSAALNNDMPFGGLNFVFAGDFAQLPPAVGKENVSLYSRTVGAVSTDSNSQLQAMGKAFWHQVTTVVILRENMRQKTQSEDDSKLRAALENMRYAKCTPDDLAFLRTRVSSRLPGAANACDDNFREVSIITATNMQKDIINELGTIRFAHEHGLKLTDFFSDDTVKTASKGGKKQLCSTLSDEYQRQLWDQMPCTSGKIAGKLSLCVGLPVMIRVNVATELCMTRGQEGYVHGWQSSVGTRNQRILDTLFIKLKNPPTNVQIQGLPENVIPMSRTTNQVYAQLPNDKIVRISRSQLEIAPNFSMTDYASQGKTRGFNLADLLNIKSHFGYYTALSRSASASGTLILQGFAPAIITRGISGALRQEFRELELLDDITKLRHASKLPITVIGDTRNALIKSFRLWKGEHYVPQSVPKTLRWSKRDPLRESEIYDADKIASLRQYKNEGKKKEMKNTCVKAKLTKSNQDPIDHPNSSAQLISIDVGSKRKREKLTIEDGVHRTSKKNRTLSPDIDNASIHLLTPLGLAWDRNSCAYDALLTILFNIWSSDIAAWMDRFAVFNPRMASINDDFKSMCISTQPISFERARDRFRTRMQDIDNEHFVVGNYTSIDRLVSELMPTTAEVFAYTDVCPNNHQCSTPRTVKSAMLSLGTCQAHSLSDSLKATVRPTRRRCDVCNNSLSVVQTVNHAPPLLAFDFAGLKLSIDDWFCVLIDGISRKYTLRGVIYFGHAHFTSRIVRCDGQIWYHDGVDTGRDTVFDGNLITSGLDMHSCRGRTACMAIYALS